MERYYCILPAYVLATCTISGSINNLTIQQGLQSAGDIYANPCENRNVLNSEEESFIEDQHHSKRT